MLQIVLRVMGVAAVLVVIGLVMAMFLTSPGQLGPYGITLWFTGLLVCMVLVITLAIYKFKSGDNSAQLLSAARVGFLSGTWIVGLLALGSLRQLTLRDIILITILVVAVNFFIKRMSS